MHICLTLLPSTNAQSLIYTYTHTHNVCMYVYMWNHLAYKRNGHLVEPQLKSCYGMYIYMYILSETINIAFALIYLLSHHKHRHRVHMFLGYIITVETLNPTKACSLWKYRVKPSSRIECKYQKIFLAQAYAEQV